MSSELYRQIILDHFRAPHHAQTLKHADIEETKTNESCGDSVRVQLHFEKDALADVAFITSGCAVSIAAASVLSDLILGKTRSELASITPEKLLKELGINPAPARAQCALLPLSALLSALKK